MARRSSAGRELRAVERPGGAPTAAAVEPGSGDGAASPAPPDRAPWRAELPLRRLWLFVPGVVALVALVWAQASPEATEHVFSRGIYPWASAAVGFLPSLVPFSVAEWVVAAAVLAVAAFLVHYGRRLARARRGCRAAVAGSAALTAIGAVSVAYFLFMLLFGLNYHRLTFAESAGLDVRPSTAAELEALCWDLADDAVAARAELGDVADLDAYAAERGGFEAYAAAAAASMEELSAEYPALARPLWSRPKPVLASWALSAADIRGIFFPFTVESNVNVQPPFFTLPVTMAHELAHQGGFAREDEANFIGYLACRDAEDPLVRYSGAVRALDYAVSALAGVDPDAAREVLAALPEAVRADRRADAEFWAAWHSPLSDASQAANDAFLRANGQGDGTRSYGRMVDLLLADRRARVAG